LSRCKTDCGQGTHSTRTQCGRLEQSCSPQQFLFAGHPHNVTANHFSQSALGREFLGEVLGTHSFNRCSKLRERGIHSFAVFSVCADQNIQIFRRTRLRMKRNRISANYQVPNLSGVESG
jgi:hypothetical protein